MLGFFLFCSCFSLTSWLVWHLILASIFSISWKTLKWIPAADQPMLRLPVVAIKISSICFLGTLYPPIFFSFLMVHNVYLIASLHSIFEEGDLWILACTLGCLLPRLSLFKYLSKTLGVCFHGDCNMFTVVSVLYFSCVRGPFLSLRGFLWYHRNVT